MLVTLRGRKVTRWTKQRKSKLKQVISSIPFSKLLSSFLLHSQWNYILANNKVVENCSVDLRLLIVDNGSFVVFYFIFYKKNQITSSSSVTCMDFTMEMIPCFVCGSLLKSSLNEITNGRAFIEQTIKVKAALECCLFSELLDLESVLGYKRTKWYHWWLEYPEITLNRGITPQPSPPEKKILVSHKRTCY